jgi:RNA polymerase sigma-70 factor, ECF subfamily
MASEHTVKIYRRCGAATSYTRLVPMAIGRVLHSKTFPLQRSKILLIGRRATSISREINAAGNVSGYIICRHTLLKDEMPETHEITTLLQAWSKGDLEALGKLIPLVDRELKKIAHAHMRNERPGHLLQTTALMDEALIKLMETNEISWHDRRHFYSLAARRMHHVLVNYARRDAAVRRGNRPMLVDLEEAIDLPEEISNQLPLLHEALKKLALQDTRKANVVELRYFGGFSFAEIAKILEVAKITVERDWKFARSWLRNEISGPESLNSTESAG